MNYIAVFDSDGRCLYIMETKADYVDEGKICVPSDTAYDPNGIFYDTQNERIMGKSDYNLTISTNTLSGIPVGTVCHVSDGNSFQVDDGELELEVEFNDTLSVTLENIKYKIKTVEVPCEA